MVSGDRPPTALRATHSGCRHLAIELCATRWHLLRCGNLSLPLPIVGRFLPRLGSLAMLVTLFLESRLVAPSPTPPPHEREGRGGGNRDVDQSSLFRSGPIGMQFLQGDLVEPV